MYEAMGCLAHMRGYLLRAEPSKGPSWHHLGVKNGMLFCLLTLLKVVSVVNLNC